MEQVGQGDNLDTDGIVGNAGDTLEVPLDNPHNNLYDMGYRGKNYEGDGDHMRSQNMVRKVEPVALDVKVESIVHWRSLPIITL